ncbi:MAG: AAA family ATPase [Clostridiales bacterium]|nr:AAA family ATPase [Clostridiales bacterium]
MNKTVVFMFSWDWLLQHRMDAILPIQKICDYVAHSMHSEVVVSNETNSSIELQIVSNLSAQQVKDRICSFLRTEYSDFSESKVECEETDSIAATEAKTDSLDDIKHQFDRLFATKSHEIDVSASESWQRTLVKIDNIIGGDEFKSLAHEIVQLAPQLKANGTQKIFMEQRYIFAINDGSGLDNYLQQLVSLINELEIARLHRDVINLKLQARTANEDPRVSLIKQLEHKLSSPHLVCIDISEWMNDVNIVEFKEFMTVLKQMCEDSVLVFRIPFVDKEIMNNIARALNDMLFIRALSFPPYTKEQIGQIATRLLEQYGFSMDKSAWKGFYDRIREEGSDGRFYGEDTVSKVVGELLYYKQLSNARERSNSKVITSNDTEKLCSVEFAEDISGMEMLDKMVGTATIKQRILEIISQIELIKQNPSLGSPCLHMRFVGNPGTGKTTVARIIGKILKEKNILRVGEFYEHSGRDFCGRYIGQTAPKTLSICREAYGSVLFIDEAYSLHRGDDDTKDFGREALDTLIAEMENHRNDFVIIMAGYTDEMNKLLRGNAGLASRMPYTIEFPNFTRQQLYDIFLSMCKNSVPYTEEMLADAKQYFLNLDETFVTAKNFSNARYVRNLYERVCAKAAMRTQLAGEKHVTLTKEDFTRAIADKDFVVNVKKTSKIGFGN